MASNVHMISGLPRSGSTLLCALFRQNPRYHASVTSPVVSLLAALLPKMSSASEFSVFFDDERRRAILRSVFYAYHGDASKDKVVFDTNRSWTGRAALVSDLFPEARIICCVRDVGWIIDSIERLLRENPLQLSKVFKFQLGSSIYSRAAMLMDAENGLIGPAWSCLREAWFSEYAKKLIVLNYDRFVRNPAATMARLYEALNEQLYPHDFEHVSYEEPGYDMVIGMPGLHKVHPRVEWRPRQPCIPPDLFAKFADFSFWLNPSSNPGGATIL